MNEKTKMLKGKRVLLIEDDEVDQMLLKFMIEDQGAKFYMEDEEERALLRLQKEKFDLVFLDTRLNNANVVDLTRRIRQLGNKDMNIIGMSSVDLLGRGISQGLDQVMLRPLEYSKFINTLYSLLRK